MQYIKHEEECLSRIFKLREVGWKTGHSRAFFLTDFKVFGYLLKHCFECFDVAFSKLIIEYKENEWIKSPKIYAN